MGKMLSEAKIKALEKLSILEVNTERIHPAQDFMKNTIIYGYLDPKQNNWVFLTGDSNLERDVLDEDEARNQFGFGELQRTAPIQELTPSIIRKCYESTTIVNTKILSNELTAYIAEFVYLDDANQYRLLATWIMGTYQFKCFTYYPYLWLNAEKGSGKSTLLNLLSKLSFNGLLLDAASSTASLYRMIELASPTLLIDEFEMMDKTKATDLGSILRSGFHADSKLSKSKKNKDDFEPELFGIYCPKAIASINDIQDTLKERCITIRMLKKPKNEERSKFNYQEEKGRIQIFKEKLFRFGLMHSSEITAKYVGKSSNIRLPDHISDREKDLWQPLMTISFHIDLEHATDFTGELSQMMDKSSEQRKYENYLDHEATKMIVFLYRLTTKLNPDHEDDSDSWYSNDSIYQFFISKENRELTGFVGRTALGKKLANLNLEQKTMNKGKTRRYYNITSKIIVELADRYDIPNEYLYM
ncbi:hypothetical protein QFZ81_005765 [Paenibacillus sp. V4I9]|uniref:hypothetical protein n=1 Tax=Paenibacillus sp. V4I9 TaxID=3042308 RepID=UPI002789F651|nr:hypothetical protein [Paenibacillus sp. V4I9]MDQ0890677.1 hypothetical protein [Paenibacillus sp. V4I9]